MYPLVRDAAPTQVSLWAVIMLDYIKAITHWGLYLYKIRNPIIMH